MQMEEIKQNALYLQQQGNPPANHQPLRQKRLSDHLPTPALLVDVGTPLAEAWEMAMHSDGGLQSGLPTREEPGVEPDPSSRPTLMERTDSNKSLKKQRRTSILSAFLFASKTAKSLSTDDQDKSLENSSQPETPRKLLGRLRLPRQHSMPQLIFRRAIWNDGIDADEPKSYEKDGSGVPKDPGHEKSAACSSELAISSDFLESRDSLFTEASVIRTASTCTAPFSAVPSSGPSSIDTGPLLSTPLDNVASMSNSSSSDSPKRPRFNVLKPFDKKGEPSYSRGSIRKSRWHSKILSTQKLLEDAGKF
ncbi:hypothetical protein QFC21_004980 [Naganishia friedmannii]|uniref:Uncharacterized protein n=1 Tax=Naganishia friedmannii TaxID=89922 RepID=A0ACC2VE07_9TREE|nr:hypothetical protein QFC21_004980 [Naganishia friedmannii]